ncbi:MAG: hypothetical protein HKN25_09790 [Pyrinomonadaceae bacterium]|nr:hypothetical protein [Pyrinomonadaceae bacterium]
MKIYRGSENDLETLIKKHLFVICPNNSGSTFLKNALATSSRTWNLQREGQHTFGFAGPNTRGLRTPNRWAADQHSIDVLTDPSRFDWKTTRRAWYFQSYSRSREATVFVEKSPPFLLIVDQLVRNFPNVRFLFMVRNPYAVVEGIRRKSPRKWLDSMPSSNSLKIITTHTITCLRYQKQNIEKWGDRGASFLYEHMCDESERVEGLIRGLVPEIDDLVLRQRIQAKTYDEELRNMNEQQIERLSTTDFEQINEVFSRNRDVLDFFEYSLLT